LCDNIDIFIILFTMYSLNLVLLYFCIISQYQITWGEVKEPRRRTGHFSEDRRGVKAESETVKYLGELQSEKYILKKSHGDSKILRRSRKYIKNRRKPEEIIRTKRQSSRDILAALENLVSDVSDDYDYEDYDDFETETVAKSDFDNEKRLEALEECETTGFETNVREECDEVTVTECNPIKTLKSMPTIETVCKTVVKDNCTVQYKDIPTEVCKNKPEKRCVLDHKIVVDTEYKEECDTNIQNTCEEHIQVPVPIPVPVEVPYQVHKPRPTYEPKKAYGKLVRSNNHEILETLKPEAVATIPDKDYEQLQHFTTVQPILQNEIVKSEVIVHPNLLNPKHSANHVLMKRDTGNGAPKGPPGFIPIIQPLPTVWSEMLSIVAIKKKKGEAPRIKKDTSVDSLSFTDIKNALHLSEELNKFLPHHLSLKDLRSSLAEIPGPPVIPPSPPHHLINQPPGIYPPPPADQVHNPPVISSYQLPAPPGCRSMATKVCQKIPYKVARKVPYPSCKVVPGVECHLELESVPNLKCVPEVSDDCREEEREDLFIVDEEECEEVVYDECVEIEEEIPVQVCTVTKKKSTGIFLQKGQTFRKEGAKSRRKTGRRPKDT